MSINRPQKDCDPATLSNAKIATQVKNNEKKKKTDLQVEYMEVEVSCMIDKGKSTAELQMDKDSNKLLQEELEWNKASHKEITLRYQTEVISAR